MMQRCFISIQQKVLNQGSQKVKENVHWSGLLQFLGRGDYLLVKVGSDAEYDTEQDNVDAEVATGSHLITL
jgi:glucose/arabinose dehydrogenase